MERYKRKDGESSIEYLLRLAEIKIGEKPDDLEWSDIVNYCGFNCHYDSLRKALQPKEYGGLAIYKFLKDKIIDENVSEDNILKQIEMQKQELYKEKIKLFDQRRELNNILRKQSREDSLFDFIENTIKNSDLIPFKYSPNSIECSDNDVLVFLNDLHYGLEQENFWHTYNPKVFLKYLYKYLDEIIKIKKIHNSQKCYVFLGGDLISGLIHTIVRIENTENVIEQVQHVSEYISNFVNELSKEFSHVYIHSVAGNHSRLIQNKKEDIKNEKLDLLITWYMKARLSNIQNVFIVDNNIDSTISVFYIRGKLYYGVHGDLDSPDKVIDSLTQMLDNKPYGILIAHRHHFAIDTKHNVKVISSGSFASVDDYCITKRISGSPSQTVCICDENGLRCSYDVILNK